MDKNRKGLLLTPDMEFAFTVVRDAGGVIVSGFNVGMCVDQEAYIVLNLRPGDLKEDPILGPGLTKYMRTKINKSAVEMELKKHFERAGIDYEDYKERINFSVNNL